MVLEQTVGDILRLNIRPGSGEDAPGRQQLPNDAIENATTESMNAFLEIFEAITSHVPPSHYRTRYAAMTRSSGYGISFYTRSTNAHGRRRIQSVLLPTKETYRGYLDTYLAGHHESPVTATPIGSWPRGDELEFWIIEHPTRRFVNEVIRAFENSALFATIEQVH